MKGNEGLVGIIGGTGNLGAALAFRWARAGLAVKIGSRNRAKAEECAKSLSERVGCQVRFGTNIDVAMSADLVVVTVPFAAQAETLAEIREHVQGKIVVDTTVPLVPPKVMRVQMPPEGSAAQKSMSILGDGVRLVSAFHNVAAHRLMTDDEIRCDIMVFSDDKAARSEVVRLADTAGLRGIHAGPLVNSVAAEALTSLLIFVNKHYQVDGAGIEFTGDLKGTGE